jgi:Tfp pilus assembly protein PilF
VDGRPKLKEDNMLLNLLVAAAVGLTPVEATPQTPSEPAAPVLQTTPSAPEASSGVAQSAIEAGLAAFKRRRFSQAEAEFSRAVAADPGSAAAHFYLGYTHYKMGEPPRRMNAHKERAREEFAKAFELDPAFRPVWMRGR